MSNKQQQQQDFLISALSNATSVESFDETLKAIEKLIVSLSASVNISNKNSNNNNIDPVEVNEEQQQKARFFFGTSQTFVEAINSAFLNPKSNSETVSRCAFVSARIIETVGRKSCFLQTAKTTVYAITKGLEIHSDKNIGTILHLADFMELTLEAASFGNNNNKNDNDDQDFDVNPIKLHFSRSEQLLNAIVCILRDFSAMLMNVKHQNQGEVEEDNNNSNNDKNSSSSSSIPLLSSAIDFLTGALLKIINIDRNTKKRLATHPELLHCFDSVFEHCAHLPNVMYEAASIVKSLVLLPNTTLHPTKLDEFPDCSPGSSMLMMTKQNEPYQFSASRLGAASYSSPMRRHLPPPAQLFSNEYSLRFLVDVLAEESFDFDDEQKAAAAISDILVILTSKSGNEVLHSEVCQVLTTSMGDELVAAISKNISSITVKPKKASSSSSSSSSEACATSLFHLIGNLTSEITNPTSYQEARSSKVFASKKIGGAFIRVLECRKDDEEQQERILQSPSSFTGLGVAISNLCSSYSSTTNQTENNNDTTNYSSPRSARQLFTSSQTLCDLLVSSLGSSVVTSSLEAIYAISFAIQSLMVDNPSGQENFTRTKQSLVNSVNSILESDLILSSSEAETTTTSTTLSSPSDCIFAVGSLITTLLSDSNPLIHEALELFSSSSSNNKTNASIQNNFVQNIAKVFLMTARSPQSVEQIGQIIFVLVHPVNKNYFRQVRETLLTLKLDDDCTPFTIADSFAVALSMTATTPESCERIALSLCQLMNEDDENDQKSSRTTTLQKLFCTPDFVHAVLLALNNTTNKSAESIQWICTLIISICDIADNSQISSSSRLFLNDDEIDNLCRGLTVSLRYYCSLQSSSSSDVIIESIAGVWARLLSSSSNDSTSNDSNNKMLSYFASSQEFIDAIAAALDQTPIEQVETINTLLAMIVYIFHVQAALGSRYQEFHHHQQQQNQMTKEEQNEQKEQSKEELTDCTTASIMMVAMNENLSKALVNKLLQPHRETLNATLLAIIYQYRFVAAAAAAVDDSVLVKKNFAALSKMYIEASTLQTVKDYLTQLFEICLVSVNSNNNDHPPHLPLDILIKTITVACFFSEGQDELWTTALDVLVETGIDVLLDAAAEEENKKNGLKQILQHASPNILEDCVASTRGLHSLSSTPKVRRFMKRLRDEGAMDRSMEKQEIKLKSLVTEGDESNPRNYYSELK